MIRDLTTGQFKKALVNLSPSPDKNGTKKTAIVFSGAGARILYECGAAQAIKELINTGRMAEPVVLTGTSSGSITAAFYAANQLDILYNLCLKVRTKDIYTKNWLKFFGPAACIYDNKPLIKLLTNNLNPAAVRQFQGTVLVNITDLTTWQDMEMDLTKLDDAGILDAIIKSTSVPGAFPIRDNCVDGAVVDNFPIMDAIAQQVDRIILISTSSVTPTKIKSGMDLIGQLIGIVIYNQLLEAQRMLELVHLKNPAIELTELIVIEPPIPPNVTLLDADGLGTVAERTAMIKSAYDFTMDKLSGINDCTK